MLYAIPKTPLHDRLAAEGRLDLADEPEFGTNVIPLKIGREELRDGYVQVMNELYRPEAYFGRLDDLYIKGNLDIGRAAPGTGSGTPGSGSRPSRSGSSRPSASSSGS